MNKNKLRILVLCTGNSCRSQMAEGFFRAYGADSIEIYSAGIEPGGVNPLAVKVMREIDIDISGHTSNNLNEYLEMDFDYVITVCDNAAANCPIFPGPKHHQPAPASESHPEPPKTSHPERSRRALRVHWPILDPASMLNSESEDKPATDEEVLAVFRRIRDEIGELIKTWLKTSK